MENLRKKSWKKVTIPQRKSVMEWSPQGFACSTFKEIKLSLGWKNPDCAPFFCGTIIPRTDLLTAVPGHQVQYKPYRCTQRFTWSGVASEIITFLQGTLQNSNSTVLDQKKLESVFATYMSESSNRSWVVVWLQVQGCQTVLVYILSFTNWASWTHMLRAHQSCSPTPAKHHDPPLPTKIYSLFTLLAGEGPMVRQ